MNDNLVLTCHPDTVVWSGQPWQGLVWRPDDYLAVPVVVIGSLLMIFTGVQAASLAPAIFVLPFAGYMLVGRFHQDAHLRKQIRYVLTKRELSVWKIGRDCPECTFPVEDLQHVKPSWVNGRGIGTIELPLRLKTAAVQLFNDWDRFLPAAYPCRRLDVIENAEGVAVLIRDVAATALVERRV